MIVVGVDPGSRDTGIAVVEDLEQFGELPRLLASVTVHRGDDGPLIDPPDAYLVDVNAAILDAVRTWTPGHRTVSLLAIEGISAPKGFAKGKKHTLDPAPLIGTALVLGAVLGRSWPVPVVRIPPGDNGRRLPLRDYPGPLATRGKGYDKRRHERSAYDVASQGRVLHRLTKGRP